MPWKPVLQSLLSDLSSRLCLVLKFSRELHVSEEIVRLYNLFRGGFNKDLKGPDTLLAAAVAWRSGTDVWQLQHFCLML